MARDKASIQSMFNRGFGKFYELPDYIKSASDLESKVDHYTGGSAFREPAFESGPAMLNTQMAKNGYSSGTNTYKNYVVSTGIENKMDGQNANTTFITKFSPLDPRQAGDIVGNGYGNVSQANLIPIIMSKGINRKYKR